MLFVGLFFSSAPRLVWATSDTICRSDTLRMINTQLVGSHHVPGVFHRLARAGDGSGNGESFHVSCVPNTLEQLRCNIHSSDMVAPAMREYLVSGVTHPRTCLIPTEQVIWRALMSDDAQVDYGYSTSDHLASMIKHPGSPRSKGRQWVGPKRFPRAESSSDRLSTPLGLSSR